MSGNTFKFDILIKMNFSKLQNHFEQIKDKHLKDFFAEDPERGSKFSLEVEDLYIDYSKNRINEEIKRMRIAFVKQEGSNSVKKVLENMTQEQIEIYSALNLKRFLVN